MNFPTQIESYSQLYLPNSLYDNNLQDGQFKRKIFLMIYFKEGLKYCRRIRGHPLVSSPCNLVMFRTINVISASTHILNF